MQWAIKEKCPKYDSVLLFVVFLEDMYCDRCATSNDARGWMDVLQHWCGAECRVSIAVAIYTECEKD